MLTCAELIFNINYLGADQASFTLNFSRGASQVIGQYYQLIRLGKKGYRSISEFCPTHVERLRPQHVPGTDNSQC